MHQLPACGWLRIDLICSKIETDGLPVFFVENQGRRGKRRDSKTGDSGKRQALLGNNHKEP